MASTLAPDQANFDTFVGTLENLESSDGFQTGNGAQAFGALQTVFSAFREQRDAGNVSDDDWGKIQELAAERSTAYRVAKGDDGRFDVLKQIQAQTSPQGETTKDLEDWVSRERTLLESRPDAALYKNDFDYAAEHLITAKTREEANPSGSSFFLDNLKRIGSGLAGTVAQAADSSGETQRDIERWLASDPARDEQFISEMSQGLGSIGASMGVFIAGTGLTKNPLIGGTIASTAFNGMIRYNEGYQKAKELGAPEAVASKAGLYTTPAAFVDTVGDMFLAGKVGAGVNRAFRMGGASLPRKAILNRLAFSTISQGLGQAASEVGGDLTAAAGQASALNDPRIWDEAIAQAPRTAGVSFALGGLLGAPGGIQEGRMINSLKEASELLGVPSTDLLKFTSSGAIDMEETTKALAKAKMEKDERESPEPPKPEPEAPEGTTVPPEVPAPTMKIKTWADAFKTPLQNEAFQGGGGYELSKEQEDAINTLGGNIDQIMEERDAKERAGVPAVELKRFDDAMMSLVDSMVQIANTGQKDSLGGVGEWEPDPRMEMYPTRQEAQARVDQLNKRSPKFVHRLRKIDNPTGAAFHFELDRRPKQEFPLTGETIARARDVEEAFRDAETALVEEQAIVESESEEVVETTEDDLTIPGEQEAADDIEASLTRKGTRGNRRGERGSVLIPDADDFRSIVSNALSQAKDIITDQVKTPVSGDTGAIGRAEYEISRIRDLQAKGYKNQDKLAEAERIGKLILDKLRAGDSSPRTMVEANRFFRSVNGMATAAKKQGIEVATPKQVTEATGVAVQSNVAKPPQSDGTFAQGWRQGVQDLRNGSKEAAKKLLNMLDDAGVTELANSEIGSLSKILTRRNLTLEDSIVIEEMGEKLIAANQYRERLQSLKEKRAKARKMVDTEKVGVLLIENDFQSPISRTERFLDVAQTQQPVETARALVSIRPAEVALIESKSPGFMDAYEQALDSIIASTRASQVDPAQMDQVANVAHQFAVDLKRRRLRSRISYVSGAINKAEQAGDDVSVANTILDQAKTDLADATLRWEFDKVEDNVSNVMSELEKLPSVVQAKAERAGEKDKAREQATNRTIKLSNELGHIVDDIRTNVNETARQFVYDAFKNIKPSHLTKFSTLDIEGIGDVIEQVKQLAARGADATGLFNRFATRMAGNLYASKLEDRYPGAAARMHHITQPNERANKLATIIRNNPFIRYLTEQQSSDVANLKDKDLQGTLGFLTAQNLLMIDDQLKTGGMLETELFGRTDSLRTRGMEKAQSLFSPIRLAIDKLKEPKAAFSQKMRSELAKNKRGNHPNLGKLTPQNEIALDSMSLVNMALLVRQLDLNEQRENVTSRLNTEDPMIQWIEGGHEKGASPNASNLPREQQERLLSIWQSATTAAGGITWSKIQHILTPEQHAVIDSISKAMDVSGTAIRGTSATMRNTLLQNIRAYYPMHGSSNKPEHMTDEEILNARLEPGMNYAPSTIRPSSSHLRKAWTLPQSFDLQGTTFRHLAAVHVDAELTPHLYATEIMLRRMRDYERTNGLKTTSKWQTLTNGLRREHRRTAGLDVAISSMFMSGAHRGLTAIQKLLRRSVLAQVHKPIAESLSLGWIFSQRLGWENFRQSVKDYNKNKDAFMGLMMDSGSTFMSRTGMNSADMQIIDHGSYRGAVQRPNADVITQQNLDIQPGVWGWIQETKASKYSEWATRMLTSYGDHAMGGPAMYNVFMGKFGQMTGKPFSWKEYFNYKYDTRLLKEVMLQSDIDFQKLAAPNTSGLVSALRTQSSTSALVRLAKNILFPYSHFAANEKSNLFRGLRDGFNPNSTEAERKAGFNMAVTHAVGNTVYQMSMFLMGKLIVGLAGGAIASALSPGDDDEVARRMQELGEQLSDPEMWARKSVGGMIDAMTGSNDPVSRGLIGWMTNNVNKTFTEKALARPYDPYKDDIVFVRDTDTPEGIASYLIGPYSRLIEDFYRTKDDLDYILDPEKTGATPQKVADLAAILGGYTFGVPGQTTVNKIIKDSSQTYNDEDWKKFKEGLKTKEINNNVKFIVDKRGNDPEALGNYIRSIGDPDVAKKAMRYYEGYTKEKKKTNRDALKVGWGVVRDLRSR